MHALQDCSWTTLVADRSVPAVRSSSLQYPTVLRLSCSWTSWLTVRFTNFFLRRGVNQATAPQPLDRRTVA
jgi:hypothetical protein